MHDVDSLSTIISKPTWVTAPSSANSCIICLSYNKHLFDRQLFLYFFSKDEADSTERVESLVHYSINDEEDYDQDEEETEEAANGPVPFKHDTDKPDTVFGPELPEDHVPVPQIGPQLPDLSDIVDSSKEEHISSDYHNYKRFKGREPDQEAKIDMFSDPCYPTTKSLPISDQEQSPEPVVIGPKLPQEETLIGPRIPHQETVEEDLIGPKLLRDTNSNHSDTVNSDHVATSEDSDDLEAYALRELEEPVFSHYEFTNKKYSADHGNEADELKDKETPKGPEPLQDETVQSDQEESDFDDIDQQLEMALEKNQVTLCIDIFKCCIQIVIMLYFLNYFFHII